ncbi:unnamed protein product [Prorocentrum cordatum]|uniref:Receptor ligand binding region domain-containing protein n=1 Tax=Prorocentrum cordatum TaxID=2364126 RepID=A0ABN9SVJ1_9DINO|nr:unnamed protein product [Polarella glacialis]
MQLRGRPTLAAVANLLLGATILDTSARAEDIWLTSIQPFTGADWDAGISMRIGGQIMLEEINNNPNLLPGYTLRVAWQDGLCARGRAVEIFLRNLYDREYPYIFAPGVALEDLNTDNESAITTEDVEQFYEVWNATVVSSKPVGFLGSGCSGGAMDIAKTAFYARVPMVSNSATRGSLSDRSAYPNFFRTIMPDSVFGAAWVATARNLGHVRISASCGETAQWGSDVIKVGVAADDQGVTLEGQSFDDLGTWRGYQVSSDSVTAAEEAAGLLKQGASDGYVSRFVILQMYQPRARLLMCAAHQIGYKNVIWMVTGWFTAGWWYESTVSGCTAEEGFQDEWLSRQGATMEDLGMRPDGYTPALEAATTADAVCMYAQMLHQLVEVEGVQLDNLRERTPSAYLAVMDAFAASNFSGVIGQVKFAPNSPDPEGSVKLEQLQNAGTYRQVEFASFLDGVLSFSGVGLKFGLPNESDIVALPATVTHFATCTGELSLDFEANVCVPCSSDQVWLQEGGFCACASGYFKNAAGACELCSPGTFTSTPGSRECTNCSEGHFAAASGQTACQECTLGLYSSTPGLSACTACVDEDRPDSDRWSTWKSDGSGGWLQSTGATSRDGWCGCDEGSYLDGDVCRVPWPSPFREWLAVTEVFVFNTGSMGLECVLPTSPIWAYCEKLVLLLFMLSFGERKAALYCSVGAVVFSVFIAISRIIFVPFECETHPNGESTLELSQDVFCYDSGDHWVMVAIASVGAVIPTGFIALVLWVLHQLPKRVLAGDTNFMKCYTFLFCRFRPGGYWYVGVLVIRNLLIALVPIMGDASVQLILVFLFLMPSIVITPHFLPWRSPIGNVMEEGSNLAILCILFLGSLLLPTTDQAGLAVGCCLLVGAMVLCLGAAASVGAIAHVRNLRGNKAISFFLCHHKSSGVAMARVLKWKWRGSTGVDDTFKRVHLQADVQGISARSLGDVADSDMVVAICTSDILGSPWSMGELMVAKGKHIPTVNLQYPDFAYPDQKRNHVDRIKGLHELTHLGMNADSVLTVLDWMPTNPQVSLPDSLTTAGLTNLADDLLKLRRLGGSSDPSLKWKGEGDQDAPVDAACTLIVDILSHEAFCAALLLKEMIEHLVMGQGLRLRILGEGEPIPKACKQAIVVCSVGCFGTDRLTSALIEADGSGVRLVPVIVEPGFELPSTTSRAHTRANKERATLARVIDVVDKVFLENELFFFPRDSAQVLNLRLQEVADALLSEAGREPAGLPGAASDGGPSGGAGGDGVAELGEERNDQEGIPL